MRPPCRRFWRCFTVAWKSVGRGKQRYCIRVARCRKYPHGLWSEKWKKTVLRFSSDFYNNSYLIFRVKKKNKENSNIIKSLKRWKNKRRVVLLLLVISYHLIKKYSFFLTGEREIFGNLQGGHRTWPLACFRKGVEDVERRMGIKRAMELKGP